MQCLQKYTENKLNINTKTFAEQLNLMNDRVKTKICIHLTKTTFKKPEVIIQIISLKIFNH